MRTLRGETVGGQAAASVCGPELASRATSGRSADGARAGVVSPAWVHDDPEAAEPVSNDDASWSPPNDDHAWEADADGYPESDDCASAGDLPVELDPDAGD